MSYKAEILHEHSTRSILSNREPVASTQPPQIVGGKRERNENVARTILNKNVYNAFKMYANKHITNKNYIANARCKRKEK